MSLRFFFEKLDLTRANLGQLFNPVYLAPSLFHHQDVINYNKGVKRGGGLGRGGKKYYQLILMKKAISDFKEA